MNNKKIVGDGSKATLPGGKKMEDYKKPPSYNSTTKTNAAAGSGNNPEQSEGKQKSKGEQAAQATGTEAAKQALKAAAGTIPYTKWIPKGIRDKIIDKIMDSGAGQAAVEKALKDVKRKMMLAIASLVGGIVASILGVCIIMAAILGPVSAISDIAKGIRDFFASIGNLFVYGEYCANESECQEILSNKYYDKLDKEVNDAFGKCDNVDKQQVKELITGTIFYDQMSYEYDYEGESQESIDAEKESDREEGYIQKENAGGYFDYRGKRGDISGLVKKLKSDDDKSCVLNQFAYRNHLTNNYIRNNYKYILKGEYKNGIEGTKNLEQVVEEIMLIGGFENLGANGACSSSCSYTIGDKSISELKVQLLDNDGNKIEGQGLISFENYILGVTYGEIGPDAPAEAAKAQSIAARSYALTRASVMNGAGGVKLEEVDGTWILYIRNSTNDQVYCDPDKGCGKRADGVFISDPYSEEVDPNADYKPKYGLATDSQLRTAVAEVVGVVAIDNEGNIVKTSYTNTQHVLWREKANEGLDYTEILKGSYSEITTLGEGNCSSLCSFAAGPYTEWKQKNWPDVYLGSKSIAEVGCLTVSVAMQIARSGVETPLGENFSPATLVENYRNYLYTGNSWRWEGITKVIPSFQLDWNYSYSNMASLNDQQQLDKLLTGLDAQCYYVVEVKSYRSGQHWVAVDTIKDGVIYMMDPASNCKVLNECVASTGYKYRINEAMCYRVK